MQRRVLCLMLTLATAVPLASGCGSDSKNAAATSSTGGSSGSTGGKAGVSADAGAGVPCGQKKCTPPPGVTAAVCCKDAFASTCGVQVGTACNDTPPPSTSGCPKVNAGSFTLNGCCTSTNQCGLDQSMFGGTCLELGAAKQQAAAFVRDAGALSAFPAPQACP